MNKIVIITDTHFGARNDNQALMRKQAKFNSVLFQYIRDNDIKHVVHAGDLFDRRKYINFNTLKFTREHFLEPLDSIGCQVHIVPGNHDLYYRNISDVNSMTELLRGYNNIHLYMKPTELDLDGKSLLFLPWICDENYEESVEAIEKSKSLYCVGHLELDGFEMYRGQFNNHGMSPMLFSRFDWVGSGHFHHRSIRENIHYLGAAYQLTWADYKDPRGFTVLDLDTGEYEFIDNNHEVFHIYYYDDLKAKEQIESDLQKDFSGYEDCYVKIKIVNKVNTYLFDLLLEKFQNAKPIKVSVVEENFELFSDSVVDIEGTVEDTPTMINKYVDGLNIGDKAIKLKSFMAELYSEAISLESFD